jgi:hypothetical protein
MNDLLGIEVQRSLRAASLRIVWTLEPLSALRRESITQVGRAGVGLSAVVRRGR